jgi:hypothetical protein
MKRHWIEFGDSWRRGPMSYWVHVEADGQPNCAATRFDPPTPARIAGRGYARFYVEAEGATLYFASLDELRVCIATMSQRVLPSTLGETRQRGVTNGPGPNEVTST